MGKTYQIYKYATSKNGEYGRLYDCWRDMFKRVNPDSTKKCWEKYRFNKISVCQEWYTWDNFADWAISNGYKCDLTLDRIDPLKNYCKENCQWISLKENVSKMRNGIERKKVKCIELDKIYDSSETAERILGITTGSIRRAANTNHLQKTAGGYHWEYL